MFRLEPCDSAPGKRMREHSQDSSAEVSVQTPHAQYNEHWEPSKARRVEAATPFEHLLPTYSDSRSRATTSTTPLSPQLSFHSTSGYFPSPVPGVLEPSRLSHDGHTAVPGPTRTTSFNSTSSVAQHHYALQHPIWPPPGFHQQQPLQRTTSAPDLARMAPGRHSAMGPPPPLPVHLSMEAGLLQKYRQPKVGHTNDQSMES